MDILNKIEGRHLASAIAGLLCLLPLSSGILLWFYAWQVEFGQSFYSDLAPGYGIWGAVPVVTAAIALRVVGRVAANKRASVWWLFIPFVYGFFALGSILASPPVIKANLIAIANGPVSSKASAVSDTLMEWGATNKHFPESDTQLGDVLKKLSQKPSLFARDGMRLPFRIIYKPNATGPYLPSSPGPEPAIIYCAVTADLRQFWLTATVLDEPVGAQISFLKDLGKNVILQGKL